jgi:hypothetical protein
MPPCKRWDPGVEDQAGFGGIVVCDEHDGTARVLGAHLRHDIEGVTRRQHASQVVPAAGDVVPHARCGQGGERRSSTPVAATDQGTRCPRRAQQGERPPVVAVDALGFDPSPRAVLTQPRKRPFRRPSLPR